MSKKAKVFTDVNGKKMVKIFFIDSLEVNLTYELFIENIIVPDGDYDADLFSSLIVAANIIIEEESDSITSKNTKTLSEKGKEFFSNLT